MPETMDEKETWNWLKKADLKVETEAILLNKLRETYDR